MAAEKIEAIKKVTETVKKPPAEEVITQERVPPNQEHFNALMNQDHKHMFGVKQIDGVWVTPEGSEIAFQSDKEMFESQRMGTTAVDPDGSSKNNQQQNKRKQSDSIEEIEGISSTSSDKRNSLLDEVGQINRKVQGVSQLNPEEVKLQANELIAQIENVKEQLARSKTDLKPSYKNVLQNRLTHIDDSLKIALSKAGVEYTPPEPVTKTSKSNPIERFIGMLSNGQYQLQHLSNTIDQLNITGAALNPAAMLALQIKVGYVQQQIELFTSILNKALESTKTIMNVQV